MREKWSESVSCQRDSWLSAGSSCENVQLDIEHINTKSIKQKECDSDTVCELCSVCQEENWFNLHVSTSAGSHRYTCTTAPSTERQTGCRQVQEQHLTTELHSVSAGDGPASWCEVWDSRNESWTFKSTSVVVIHAAPKIWADSVNRSILLERRPRSVYSQPEKTLKKQNIAARMWAWWWHHATSQPNLPTLPVSARRFLFKPFIWSNSRQVTHKSLFLSHITGCVPETLRSLFLINRMRRFL